MATIEAKKLPLIKWELWYTLPRDANAVLSLKSTVLAYRIQHQMVGPNADDAATLQLLNSNHNFRSVHNSVNHPITFLLPTSLLRILRVLPIR